MKYIVIICALFVSCKSDKYVKCEPNLSPAFNADCFEELILGKFSIEDILKDSNAYSYNSFRGSDNICFKVFYKHTSLLSDSDSIIKKTLYYFNKELLYRVRTRITYLKVENKGYSENKFSKQIKEVLCPTIFNSNFELSNRYIRDFKFGKSVEGIPFFEYDIKAENYSKIEYEIDVPLR